MPPRLLHADAVVEVVGEDGVDVFAGANGLVVDTAARTKSAEFFEVAVHGFEVAFSERSWVADQFAGFFETFKAC